MEVIDKRGNKQVNDWRVGDVVCFWEDVENKRYAIITHINQEDGYGLTNLGVNAGIEENLFAATPSSVINILFNCGYHFEKVNAHLVVED